MNTRHWNLIQGFALAALLPLFAACSSEGDELLQSEEKQPVQVNITRAATDGNDWSWGTGDEVTLSITPYSSTATTHKLTYDGSNWSANPEIGEITLPAIAQAYYPGTTSSDVNIVSMDEFKVNCTQITSYKAGDAYINGYIDQSSKDKMAKFDWMTAQQNISEPSFNLTLAHILCLVTVNIKDITGFAEQRHQQSVNSEFTPMNIIVIITVLLWAIILKPSLIKKGVHTKPSLLLLSMMECNIRVLRLF